MSPVSRRRCVRFLRELTRKDKTYVTLIVGFSTRHNRTSSSVSRNQSLRSISEIKMDDPRSLSFFAVLEEIIEGILD